MMIYSGVNNALIGYTGFVGMNILQQKPFMFLYNSKNIEEIKGKEFDLIVCSGAPGFKWLANKYHKKDCDSITRLINCLTGVKAKRLVLISTIDVYHHVDKVNEDSPIHKNKLNPYGKHRRILEEYIERNFNATIVRLPGIFGKGLKGGLIYDFIYNNFKFIPKRGLVQFYNLNNIWDDIIKSIESNISVINFATEPISVYEIAEKIFNNSQIEKFSNTSPYYNMHTKYSNLWGKKGDYLYLKKEILNDMQIFSTKFNLSIN